MEFSNVNRMQAARAAAARRLGILLNRLDEDLPQDGEAFNGAMPEAPGTSLNASTAASGSEKGADDLFTLREFAIW